MTERRDPPIKIDVEDRVYSLAFSVDGKLLFSGCNKGVRVSRVRDGKQIAMIEVPPALAERLGHVRPPEPPWDKFWDHRGVYCLAVSNDGRRIAGGISDGRVFVWDSATYEIVFEHKFSGTISVVNFSPGSTRLLVASIDHTVTIWDIATQRQILGPLPYNSRIEVTAAKFSPQGDRIATATYASPRLLNILGVDCGFVRVYDSNDGRLLVNIRVQVTPWPDSLLWFNNHLIIASTDKIKEIDASTGSTISEWLVPGDPSSIALPKHGEFIALSWCQGRTLTFWDISTHAQLNLTQHAQDIRSMTLSPDGQVIATSPLEGQITMKRLSRITEPNIEINDIVLDLWKHGQLADAEALLDKAISAPEGPSRHALASRALVRARLGNWDAAIDDAKESIRIEPSVIGYIAKSVGLVGKGKKHEAYRVCDIAFEHFRSSCVGFLLLVKAILAFMAGEHDDGISRVDDLIDTIHFNSICFMVQPYMHLLLGNSCMESHDYEGAIRWFGLARARVRPHTSRALLVVSLVSGWEFDDLSITIRRQLCEALYAAGHAKEAGEAILETVAAFGEAVCSEPLAKWISDFTQRCLAIRAHGDGVTWNAVQKNDSFTSRLLREWAKAALMHNSWEDSLAAAVGFATQRFMVYRVVCEHLENIDRILDACQCFLQMATELASKTTTHSEQTTWAVDFGRRCAEKLVQLGDAAVDERRHDDAITQYSAALSLNLLIPHVFIKRSKVYMSIGLWENALHDAEQVMSRDPSSPWGYTQVLTEWARVDLTNGLWKGALSAARDFKIPRLTIYQTLYEGLQTVEGTMEALECYHQMVNELTEEAVMQGEQAELVLDFRYRCSEKLERLGDAAADSQRHDDAVRYYSAALSIHPPQTQRFLILRSKVLMAERSWEDAINEARQAIALDPSSPWGHETMHAAQYGAGCHPDAVQAFETMLSKMAESPDPQIRARRGQYITPSHVRATIRKIIQRTIRHSPRVLIDTSTGRLRNKAEQISAFMSLPIVDELISSMTTRIDRARIKREVKQFFRYVMFSHRWEENEPLFHQVIHIAVYDLDRSPTHDKLQTFCRIVRDAGINWAWSDTCCIDKQDHFVLQEALVAMFKWYRGSALVIVFLRGVRSEAELGELVRSIWNTRAWTLQEYVASKVIRFYTEDWTPYLDLDTFNHKESPQVISEMETATGVPAQQLMSLRPGLSSIREKLRLASTRQTTLVEDVAYSLLGIFSISGLPVIYGEGENALGRLLAHILTGSGDTSILAWTGQSGGYNSCLPAQITVFDQIASSHIPLPIDSAAVGQTITNLRATAVDVDVALRLYDRLSELPAPWFATSRMKLPCIVFKLPPLSLYRTPSGRVYRADTPTFGIVEIQTKQDPARLGSLYLVHPWLDDLLDRDDVQTTGFVEGNEAEVSSSATDDGDISDEETENDLLPLAERESRSPSRIDTAPIDRETRALRLVAHLRQPFGALLLSLTSTRQRSVVYRRVAADSMITVQIRESVQLADILESVRILDVL